MLFDVLIHASLDTLFNGEYVRSHRIYIAYLSSMTYHVKIMIMIIRLTPLYIIFFIFEPSKAVDISLLFFLLMRMSIYNNI